MSLTNSPYGYQPVYHPSGQIRQRTLRNGVLSTYGTGILKYQPVVFSASDGTLKAVVAGDANPIVGIFAGCEYTPSGGGRRIYSPNWPASAAYDPDSMYAYYWADPELRYKVQADGSIPYTGGASAAIGAEAPLSNAAAGSTFTGMSAATLSATLKTTGVQSQFRIVDLYQDPTNAWGDAFTQVIVMISNQQFTAPKVSA